MIIPKRLKKGDTIGVVAPSNPIIGDNIEEIEQARKIGRCAKRKNHRNLRT